jgi:alpha-1,3-mannosyl-glycoprotein beta-1,2-N-acetylglucosaminyltransferase
MTSRKNSVQPFLQLKLSPSNDGLKIEQDQPTNDFHGYQVTMLPAQFRRCCGLSRWSKKYYVFLILAMLIFVRQTVFRPKNAQLEQSEERLKTHVEVPVPSDFPLNQDSKSIPLDDRIAVLVMCATRAQAVKNHLDQLVRLRPSIEKFPIVISQDGTTPSVTEAIQLYVNESTKISFIHHRDRTGTGSAAQKSARNYFYIAQHYKWALDKIFKEMGFKTVIVTEDDLDLAEDFFSYFSATKRLLYEDPTILCISAWNDNGNPKLADRKKSEQLYRTDFFPGLGWMLTSALWNELSQKWPEAYWDDWLRRREIRNDRVCIRPEVSRTVHNMKVAGKGSSGGMYKAYLSSIQLPDSAIDFSLIEVDRFRKIRFDAEFGQRLMEARPLTVQELFNVSSLSPQNACRVVYNDPRQFREIAKRFTLMNDIRSGMARTAYYGVVPFFVDGIRIYLIHKNLDLNRPFGTFSSQEIYDEKWDKMARYLDFSEFYCKPSRWTGTCDPKDPGMIDWFKRRNQLKRLNAWGKMIVF